MKEEDTKATMGLHPMQSRQAGDVEEVNGFGEGVEGGHGTQRGLKSRHAQMIALGGTIGTGLFVGSGQALQMGGPCFLLVAYIIMSLLVYGIVTATTEFSSYLPVRGSSVNYFAARYVSSSLGFALGWMYWYIFAITVPAEITATSLVIEYWNPPVHVAVWITISMVVIIALNCFPVKVYGEAEFWFASLKVFGLIALLITALVIVCGGGPNAQALGFRYWHDPGPVKEYLVSGGSGKLCAFIGTWVFSVFAFAFAPELIVVTGGEMQSPRRNLPSAGRRYIYRLIFFYVLGSFFIGLIVSSDNDRLLGGGKGAGSSPWAIAISEAGISVYPDIVNGIILTSAWSAGNSYLYLSSRALYSMALVGTAPRVFARCTKSGVPYYALAASASVSLLAYLNVASTGAVVFNWLINLINAGAFQSWIAVCIIYLRFRKGTEVQGVTDLPYRSRFQPYMAWVCGITFFILMLLNGFKVFVGDNWDVSSFLTAYIGIPIFLGLYFGHRFTVARNEPWYIDAKLMDLVNGMDQVLAAETPKTTPNGSKFKVLSRIFG
ncbi:hypothetical protein J7T55_005296 [Diaporthe amygdali]|uniref:uncharacterized protein n=1 Tax=Phomopsis amygdali TaxID=1214568 RepID=UPI0022FE40C1|nr:uncharacterized protein J7T55_005296 [Diaporthe amygdali]KAJ0108319.1 hypothetical protein J7T55_005296 [Diaporthe amygdali]